MLSKATQSNGNGSLNGDCGTKYVNETTTNTVNLMTDSTQSKRKDRAEFESAIRPREKRGVEVNSRFRAGYSPRHSTRSTRSYQHKLRTRLIAPLSRTRRRSSQRLLGHGYLTLFGLTLGRSRTWQRQGRKYGYKRSSESVTSSFSYLPCHSTNSNLLENCTRSKKTPFSRGWNQQSKRINDVPIDSKQHRSLRVCTCS